MKLINRIIALWLCFTPLVLPAQGKTDSLIRLIKQDKPDTNKINHLNTLGNELMYQNPDTAIILSKQALNIAEKNKFKKHIANSLSNIGVYNWVKGEFPTALAYQFKALKQREEINDQTGKASSLANIGIVYWSQSETQKALNYLLKALHLFEKLNNKKGIAKNTGNIGVLYDQMANHQMALTYYFKALKLNEELGEKTQAATQLGNIGVIYQKMANDTLITQKQKDSLLEKALTHYLKALELEEALQNSAQIARHKGNIGSLYMLQKKYEQAEKFLLDAVDIYKTIKMVNEKMQFEYSLSELYEITGNAKKSFEYYKKYCIDKDTLFNTQKNDEITRNELNYEFEKKEAANKAIQDKKDAVTKAEKKKQLVLLLLVASIGLVVTIITLVSLRSLKKTKKQKAIIELQKLMVEEKQKELLDSINYARRIQNAILPNQKTMEKKLNRLIK